MTTENKGNNVAKMSRRTFIKGSGAAAVALGGAGIAGTWADVAEGAPADLSNAKTFTSSCTMECLHHNLKGYVVDGKLVKVETNYPGDPTN